MTNNVEGLKKEIESLQEALKSRIGEVNVLNIQQGSAKLLVDELTSANIDLKTFHSIEKKNNAILKKDFEMLIKENHELKFKIKELTKEPPKKIKEKIKKKAD